MNRKYRQRGYQDGDRDDDRSRPSAPQRQQLSKEEKAAFTQGLLEGD